MLEMTQIECRNLIAKQIQREFTAEWNWMLLGMPTRRSNLEPLCLLVHIELDRSYRIKLSDNTMIDEESILEVEIKRAPYRDREPWVETARWSGEKMKIWRFDKERNPYLARICKAIELALGCSAINFILDLDEEYHAKTEVSILPPIAQSHPLPPGT